MLSRALSFIIAIVVLIAGIIASINYWVSAGERESHQRAQEWRSFVMAHHCTVARPASFWDSDTVWSCDGGAFQIVRYPGE